MHHRSVRRLAITLALLTVLAACSSEGNGADVQDDTTASCVQGEDWPVFDGGLEAGEGQIAATSGDIDLDLSLIHI